MRTGQSMWVMLAAILTTVLFLHGCETCKGAANGFKKDMSGLKQVDNWMQDNLW